MGTDENSGLLQDDGFMSMEDIPSFDSLDADENTPQNAESKLRKKSDFAFTSLWRKPKLGRRKTKSIGKTQGSFGGGRYFKDRESFDTAGSVPLSDFDEAKDSVPFIDFRTSFTPRGEEGLFGASDSSRVLKEKTATNPKMFFKPTPTKQGAKQKNENWDSAASSNYKPPQHNSGLEGFRSFPRPSTSKQVVTEASKPERKFEEWENSNKNENLFEDSFYSDGLYHDHGPILSSLSEDTTYCTHTSVLRGESFIDDNYQDPDDRNIQGRKLSHSKTENKLKEDLSKERYQSDNNEIKARPFSDRLKQFQSNSTGSVPFSKPSSNPKNKCFRETDSNLERGITENLETFSAGSLSEIEIPAPSTEKLENQLENNNILPESERDEPQKKERETNLQKLDIDATTSNEKLASFSKKYLRNSTFPSTISDDSTQSTSFETGDDKSMDAFPNNENQKNETSLRRGCDDQGFRPDKTESSKSENLGTMMKGETVSQCLEQRCEMQDSSVKSNNVSKFASKFGGTIAKRRSATGKCEWVKSCSSKTTADIQVKVVRTESNTSSGTEPIEDKTDKTSTRHSTDDLQESVRKFNEATKQDSSIEKIEIVETDDSTSVAQNEKGGQSKLQQARSLRISEAKTNAISFAQNSASVFGVTLSSRRSRKKELSREDKDRVDSGEAVDGCIDRLGKVETSSGKEQDEEVDEKREQNIALPDPGETKTDTKFVAKNPFERNSTGNSWRTKINQKSAVIEQTKEHEDLTRSQNVHKKEEGPSALDEQKPVPKKKSSSLLAERLKMFEQGRTEKNMSQPKQVVNDACCEARKDRQDINMNELSPKSAETQKRESLGDESVATRRRSTESAAELEDNDGLFFSQHAKSQNVDECNGNNSDDRVSSIRKTLERNQRSFRFRTNLSHLKAQDSTQSINNEKHTSTQDNLVENRRKTLRHILEERKKLGGVQKQDSPAEDGHSGHKRFFENIDRREINSSSASAFGEEQQPVITNMSFQEDRSAGDESLPMFVTVEDDFMMKDNISTCLSASENRSVVCRPDALLYSVSQKAIAMMSTKNEKSSNERSAYDSNQSKTVERDVISGSRFTSSRRITRETSNHKANSGKSINTGNGHQYEEEHNGSVKASRVKRSSYANRYERVTGEKEESQARRESSEDNKADTRGSKREYLPTEIVKKYNQFGLKDSSTTELQTNTHAHERYPSSEKKVDIENTLQKVRGNKIWHSLQEPYDENLVTRGYRVNEINKYDVEKQNPIDKKRTGLAKSNKSSPSHTFKLKLSAKSEGQESELCPDLLYQNRTNSSKQHRDASTKTVIGKGEEDTNGCNNDSVEPNKMVQKPVMSMSIRERRMFFESQAKKN